MLLLIPLFEKSLQTDPTPPPRSPFRTAVRTGVFVMPNAPTVSPTAVTPSQHPQTLSPPHLDLIPQPISHTASATISPSQNQDAHTTPLRNDDNAIYRRRRDVRAARDRLGEQFEQLRRVLPDPPPGVELTAKAQVLEYSLDVIQSLMKRATELAMELAVVTPDATRRWVQSTSNDGRKPLLQSVVNVMKLFAARRKWLYAEWWTLDEKQNADSDHEETPDSTDVDVDKPTGVVDDPNNVHGCVVRDSMSVMRLGWTLINRSADNIFSHDEMSPEEDRKLSEFARASKLFEFRPRKGMPGRVWTSRRPEWLISLEDEETFIRSLFAKEFGMKTCLAVPIQFGGHVHSVMAFYSRECRPYDPECYDLACLLSQCLEEAYSPSDAGPWQISTDPLFPLRHH